MGLLAVPDPVHNGINVSVLLNEEITTCPKLQQLAGSLSCILIQDRAPKIVTSYVSAF